MAEWVVVRAAEWVAEWAEWVVVWAEWVDRPPCPRCASSQPAQFSNHRNALRRWFENTLLGFACPVGKER